MTNMRILLSLLLISISWFANAQVNLVQLSNLPFTTTCAGVRGYVDVNNNEYALIGAGNGLAIVDVTDPTNPNLLFTVPANNSLWREVAVYQNYAYTCTEGGGGVTIVDLSNLPNSYSTSVYDGDGPIAGQLGSAHTIQVFDEYLYIFGADVGVGGAIICSLSNPAVPTYVGLYDLQYIHDGYVRNDTLWAAEIYAGQFTVIDVTNKANPNLLAAQSTPGNFTHNTWLSDNSQFLFTTDEVPNAPVGSYDITDIQNIQLVDAYVTDLMPSEEVHNVRVLDDFLVNPSYGSQITIVDALYPDNLIEIASFPTGNYLCWDADPYLPSGNIIATDVGGGLYVFAPYYVRACYLEGTVTDQSTSLPINGVSITLVSTTVNTSTDVTGEYKTGIPTAGTYDVTFSKAGYITQTIAGVQLTNGTLTVLDAQLVPFVVTGQVVDAATGNPVPFADVKIADSTLSSFTITDANGDFTFNSLTSGMYEVTAAKWGYKSGCMNVNLGSGNPVVIMIEEGIYDDFTFNYSWTVSGNAAQGAWERGEPNGTTFSSTQANPEFDSSNDCSDHAFVTGNNGTGPADDDVDDGETVLTSPVFDLTGFNDPYLNYERWFFEQFSTNPNANDTMFISMTNGVDTEIFEIVTGPDSTNSTWVAKSYRIKDFITPTNIMQVIVSISDKPGTGNPLEGGFDRFEITDVPLGINENSEAEAVNLFPNPADQILIVAQEFVNKFNVTGFEVIDVRGRQVLTGTMTGSEINVSGLTGGVYMIRFLDKGELLGQGRFMKR
jgi:choice-of-anchor B domain-containing protein